MRLVCESCVQGDLILFRSLPSDHIHLDDVSSYYSYVIEISCVRLVCESCAQGDLILLGSLPLDSKSLILKPLFSSNAGLCFPLRFLDLGLSLGSFSRAEPLIKCMIFDLKVNPQDMMVRSWRVKNLLTVGMLEAVTPANISICLHRNYLSCLIRRKVSKVSRKNMDEADVPCRITAMFLKPDTVVKSNHGGNCSPRSDTS